ncbi:nif-like protein [Fusarium austroafricanum]|uniref:Nif-like protein n=1 Tax=Fusarium austroafricanum TaxID=2364996 RepID=A0A8H4KEF7_9HYPO|nr:nif-like protein [Fusarium austroafricanum]
MHSEQLFDAALETVRNGLSQDDMKNFKSFQNHQEMLAALKTTLNKFPESRSKLVRCCQRIASFSDAFAPFFDVISVYVSVKPEWAAWFWGSIWLVFKTSNSKRLGQALAFIYHDFIEFTISLYFIFSKHNKRRIRRALLGVEFAVKPFDFRFAQLIERIKKHQIWFETEAKIQEHDMINQLSADFRDFVRITEKDAEKDLAKQRADTAEQVRDLKAWVNSPNYMAIYEGVRDRIYPNSGHWFLEMPEYIQLKTKEFPDSHLRSKGGDDWLKQIIFAQELQAKPGFGKTFLSVTIAEDLINAAQELPDSPPAVAFFHFNQLDQGMAQHPDLAFRAIAAQLVHIHRNDTISLDSLAMVETETGSGQRRSSMRDIRLILDVLLRQHPTFIVIDGVDECSEPDMLLEVIRGLCIDHDCRFILLGRPNVRIPSTWTYYNATLTRLRLTPTLMADDIGRYIHSHLEKLAMRGLFGHSVRTVKGLIEMVAPDLITNLSNKAEGLFLWAQLLVNLLGSPGLTPGERFGILKNPGLLHGLDAIYSRILDTIRCKTAQEQEIAQKIFQWISFSSMQISLAEFRVILALTPGQRTTELDYLPEYPECIPMITSSLVEVSTAANRMSFIHVTFKDFLCGTPNESLQSELSGDEELPDATDVLAASRETNWRRPVSRRRQDRPAPYQLSSDFIQQREKRPSPQHHWGLKLNSEDMFSLRDHRTIHFNLATTCLSHLTFDIPAEPLERVEESDPSCSWHMEASSNTIQANAEEEHELLDKKTPAQRLQEKYPFLRYSALFWYHHLHKAHTYGEVNLSLDPPPLWVTLLSEFLVNRYRVTMWVEAAYMYGLAPRLSHFLPLVGYLSSQSGPSSLQIRECWWVSLGLSQLSEALYFLWTRHGSQLLQNPTLIWQKGIERAEDAHFWPNWETKSTSRVVPPPSLVPPAGGGWVTERDIMA